MEMSQVLKFLTRFLNPAHSLGPRDALACVRIPRTWLSELTFKSLAPARSRRELKYPVEQIHKTKIAL